MDKSKAAQQATSLLAGKLGLFAIVAFVAAALFVIYGPIRGCSTERSYRKAVLQELQNAHDSLAYTLVCQKRNWRRPARFNLMHMDKVPELFADRPKLRKDIQFLYESFDGGMNQAAELRRLLAQENADPVTLENLEKAIYRIVDLADKVGPQVAAFVGGTWRTPKSSLTLEELTRYYEGIVTSAATDEVVTFK